MTELREAYRELRQMEGYGMLKALLALPLVLFVVAVVDAKSFECPSCGVELVGSPSGRCPECDYAFDREARIEKRLENIDEKLDSQLR